MLWAQGGLIQERGTLVCSEESGPQPTTAKGANTGESAPKRERKRPGRHYAAAEHKNWYAFLPGGTPKRRSMGAPHSLGEKKWEGSKGRFV